MKGTFTNRLRPRTGTDKADRGEGAEYAKTGNMGRSLRSLDALRGSQNGFKITLTVAELLCHEAGRRMFVRNGHSACC